MPDDLVARAHGILQLFQRIADPIPHPNTSDAVMWIPGFDWCLRPDNVIELATSIMLEKHQSGYEERSRRLRPAPFGRQNFAPQPSSPVYFKITRSYELDHWKLEATNRLMRIAPHMGLALLMMLVDSGLITEARSEEMLQEHAPAFRKRDVNACVRYRCQRVESRLAARLLQNCQRVPRVRR